MVLGDIERYYSDLCLGRNEELVSELRRLDVLRGKRVTIGAGKEITGRAAGIDENGRLILETPDGQTQLINSGEVELVRASDAGERR